MLAGGLALGTTALSLRLSIWYLVCIAIVTLILGIVAFVRNESGSRQSNNYERIAFGTVIGSLFPISWALSPWYFGALLLLIIAGQFLSAFALRRGGLLDSFFAQYFEAAMIWPGGETNEGGACGRMFCACKPSGFQLPRG